ncbi:MAG: transporter substrate-binding domain-containing protein, partial [Promicromonosporaceae bacterium]|nr:transporter substrate-binding domain-containing protein [Promicromonosporaceae bacterium]
MRTLLRPAIAAGCALLAGCTYASQGESSDTGFQSREVAPDPAAQALLPARIAESGRLIVGLDPSYAPAEFLGVDGVTPIGFDVDIAEAVGRVLGLDVVLEASTFDAIIPGVGRRYDVGISAFTIKPERLAAVTMVSYFQAGSLFAVRAGNPDGIDVANLCGATIGVQIGTLQQAELEELNRQCSDRPIRVLPYAEQATVTTNLVGGRLQAMYADSPVIGYAVERLGSTLEPLGEIRDAAPYGVVVARDAPQLAAATQAAPQG